MDVTEGVEIHRLRAGAVRRFSLGHSTLLLVLQGRGIWQSGGHLVELAPESAIVGAGRVRAEAEMVLLSVATSSSVFRTFALHMQRSFGRSDPERIASEVSDARVSKAMALMQAEPAKRWTVEVLARAVGLSRPVFARRFARSARVTPLRYLTRLRMELAVLLLRDSDASLAEIATKVGYDSEFAFGRAFKRHRGVSPGIFRRCGAASGSVFMRSAA